MFTPTITHTHTYTHTHTDSTYEPVESTMKRFNNLYGKPVIPFYRTTLYELVQVGVGVCVCVCLCVEHDTQQHCFFSFSHLCADSHYIHLLTHTHTHTHTPTHIQTGALAVGDGSFVYTHFFAYGFLYAFEAVFKGYPVPGEWVNLFEAAVCVCVSVCVCVCVCVCV